MVHMVVYASENAFLGRLAIMTIREHICGYFEQKVVCVDADLTLDRESGHRVCSGCSRITLHSGLRVCDICEKEYIDPNKYQDPDFETNCPRCVERYGIEE